MLEAGVAETLKSGSGCCVTVRVTVAVRVIPPPVAVMVRVKVPNGVLAEVPTLTEQEAVGGTVTEHPVVVAPAGRPLVMLTLTVPLNPFDGVIVAE